MVDSAKGISNLHAPNDVIVDASMPAMIRIGRSGCCHDDWVGPFCPTGLPAAEQLACDTREFSREQVLLGNLLLDRETRRQT